MFSSKRTKIESDAPLPQNISNKESIFFKAMMFCIPVSLLLIVVAAYGYMQTSLLILLLASLLSGAVFCLMITQTMEEETIVLTDKGIALKRVSFVPSTKIPLIPWDAIHRVALVRDEARVSGLALELKDTLLVRTYKAQPGITVFCKKIVDDEEKRFDNSVHFDLFIPQYLYETDSHSLMDFIRKKIEPGNAIPRRVAPETEAMRRLFRDLMAMFMMLVSCLIVYSLLGL